MKKTNFLPVFWIAFALVCFLSETVHAQIFVSESNGGSAGNGFIGEYASDGSPINTALISGLDDPMGIATSGGNIFVVNSLSGTVGEYATDGSTINSSLISGLTFPDALAISGSDIFVISYGNGGYNGTIGEYTLSGAPVNTSLVTGLTAAAGLTVIPDLFNVGESDIFLVNDNNQSIDKYTVSGGVVTASHPYLIAGLDSPSGVGIEGGDIFVSNQGASSTIGQYTLSGATVNGSLISGLDHPESLAISGSGDILVGSYGNNTIGEYTTSGGTVNSSLISGLSNPTGIAVIPTPTPEPSTEALMAFGTAALFGLCRRKWIFSAIAAVFAIAR